MLWGRNMDLRPGWHKDPTGRHQYREWDGSRWTEHVSDRGRASVDPIPEGMAEREIRSRKARRRLYVQH